MDDKELKIICPLNEEKLNKLVSEHIDELVHRVISCIYDDREKIFLQRIIKYQQKQIEDLNWKLDNLD